MVPELRIEACNQAPVRPERDYVLYWMIASRRTTWNFGLQRAIERATELKKPLLVLEPLNCDYRWASDRLHRFILEGMEENGRRFDRNPVFYYPYVEPSKGAGKGLLAALARQACVVVTDEFPCFMLPALVAAAAQKVDVLLEQVDSNGLLPLRAAEKVFLTAASFRRFLARELPRHEADVPAAEPLKGARIPRPKPIPDEILRRWKPAKLPIELSALPIDHSVAPVSTKGGSAAAREALDRFVETKLPRYAEDRNHPEREATSGLSPYLHFGHLSAHEVCARRLTKEFRDQIVTWRELGFNMSSKRPGYDRYESLPLWAQRTLEEHASDPRPTLYSLAEFESASTHDPLWNAAQTELVREGRIHNYLRMVWGKKILEWSRSPREALEIMIELNNKYAIDGRDPNSYSGIFWILGRYDRAWGPERPIFGKIRYMSSENTARKFRVKDYVARYAP